MLAHWGGIAADALIPDDVKNGISGLVWVNYQKNCCKYNACAFTANKMEAQWDSIDFGVKF